MQGRGHRLVCHPSLSNSTYMQCRRQVCGLRSRVWTLYVPDYPVRGACGAASSRRRQNPRTYNGGMKSLSRRVHRSGVRYNRVHCTGAHHTGQVASPLEAGRALRASVRRLIRGSIRRVRRRRHSNQRRLSAHIPRLHPLFTYAAHAVRAGASLAEPMLLASSELLGYRSFTHRGRNIYYRVDNLHLLSESKSAPGVLFYFDGDHLSRVGSRLLRRTSPLRTELAQVAAEFNMLSVPVLAPGSLREPRVKDTGPYAPPLTYNWWVRARSNGRMVRALIEEIALAYKVDMSRVWFAGYSGGAEFLSYELLSHDIDWIRGGGATFIGGGGADGVPARVREQAALNPSSHEHLLMSWHVGVLDGRSPSGIRRMATSAEGSWSARIAAQEGSVLYEGLGARTLLQVTPGRGHTGYPIASLVGADLAAATHLGFI